jgi:hypothetical protein
MEIAGFVRTGTVALTLIAGGALAASDPAADPTVEGHPATGPRGELIQAETPPFSEGIYPCSDCHAGGGDTTRRELGFHEDIQEVFTHGIENRWCLDCHNNENRDVLHLSNGEPVLFTESYRLCGQCHGDKYRDWRAGVHGRRVGNWNGDKTYFLCVNCHNPHAPAFRGIEEVEVDGVLITRPTLEPMKPLPPPTHPEDMRR